MGSFWDSEYFQSIDRANRGLNPLPTCANCKHWKAESNFCYEGFGECSRASSDMGHPNDSGSLAHAQDCEAYGAELNTKPDFSCIQWEPKDA